MDAPEKDPPNPMSLGEVLNLRKERQPAAPDQKGHTPVAVGVQPRCEHCVWCAQELAELATVDAAAIRGELEVDQLVVASVEHEHDAEVGRDVDHAAIVEIERHARDGL